MKDDADKVEKLAFDRLFKLAESRYQLGREKFGRTDLKKDKRKFLEETLEELIDCVWYLAAKIVQIQMLEETHEEKE